MTDPFDLQHFVDAQDQGGTFEQALAELRAGRKPGHWIWFVFPQIAGLGRSPMSQEYAISSLDEARACLDQVDAVKLRSSVTLFARAAPDEPIFGLVLDASFGGVADPATERLIS